ncbi:hypothetical protein BGX27_000944, partial [Mortierella sp. AM989]
LTAALIAANLNYQSVDAKSHSIQSQNELGNENQNKLADDVPHVVIVESSDLPKEDEKSQLEHKMMDNIQKKIGHVFESIIALAPGLNDEVLYDDTVVEAEEPVVPSESEVVPPENETREEHDEDRPNARRGDVVFEVEGEGDGQHKFHHFQGEPSSPEAAEDETTSDSEEESSSSILKEVPILSFLDKLRRILPMDWDVDYLTDDTGPEPVTEEEEESEEGGDEEVVKILDDDDTMIKGHVVDEQKDTDDNKRSYEHASVTNAEALLNQLKADRIALEKERFIFEEEKRALEENAKHQWSEQESAAKVKALLKRLEEDRIALEKERKAFEEQKRNKLT